MRRPGKHRRGNPLFRVNQLPSGAISVATRRDVFPSEEIRMESAARASQRRIFVWLRDEI